MQNCHPCTYIVTNRRNGVLYTGVTSNLPNRIWQHKAKLVAGFSQRYNTSRLVWFELHGDMEHAIMREKRIKKWNRAWKIELIEKTNPEWRDLFEDIS